jgi:trigger factor
MDLFQAVTGKTSEDLRADYRPQAVENLERSLVLGEVLGAEQIRVHDDDLQAELRKIAAQFGDQADAIMRSLNTPQMRNSVINRLLQEKAFERIAAIGRGTAPELEAVVEAEPTEVKSEEVAASEEG